METKLDGILELFNTQAHDEVVQIGVTINSGGLLFSGILASPKDFRDILSREFINSNDEHGIALGEVLSEIEIKKPTDAETKPLEYITLKNVKIINSQETLNAPLWRIKVSAIDGYTIGNF